MKIFSLGRRIAVLLFFLLILIAYSIFIEPFQIETEYLSYDYTLSDQSLTIVQFSDTHFDNFYDLKQAEKIVQAINNAQADIVVFTGDLFDKVNSYTNRDKISTYLAEINAVYGKFAVWGNHDYGGGAEKIYEQIMEESGFQVLCNEKVELNLPNSKTLTIIGLDELIFGEPDYSLLNENYTNPALLLVHEPDAVLNIAENALPFLTLTGHSHGGQVRIPFLGSPVHTVYAKAYCYKDYQLSNQSYLYVNTGLGTTTLPVRFNVKPSITVFKVTI